MGTDTDIRRIIEETLIPHTAFNDAMARVKQCLSYSEGSAEPVCLALLGESRTGKSRVLEECENDMPATRTKEGLRVPILRVKVPSNPTVKGLVEIMLHALKDPKWDAGTENRKTVRLHRLLRDCETRMLMPDEFQHFVDKRTLRVHHTVTDWFKIVVDEARVALVVAGLPSSEAVLLQNEQLAGRFLAPVRMPRFDWQDPKQLGEFMGILQSFGAELRQHFDLPELHSAEMAFRIWCATGGLIGYVTKLLRHLVWNTLDAGSRKMKLASFEKAYQAAIWTETGVPIEAQPFSTRFAMSPTPELLARVRAVGVERAEQPTRRARQSGSGKKPQALSQTLKARGE